MGTSFRGFSLPLGSSPIGLYDWGVNPSKPRVLITFASVLCTPLSIPINIHQRASQPSILWSLFPVCWSVIMIMASPRTPESVGGRSLDDTYVEL